MKRFEKEKKKEKKKVYSETKTTHTNYKRDKKRGC